MGLAFGPKGIRIPPSLKTFIRNSRRIWDCKHLISPMAIWAMGVAGVLLLNSVLTVSAGVAASHRRDGAIHRSVIRSLGTRKRRSCLCCGEALPPLKHHVKGGLVLKAPTVAPSVLRGFFGCQHFSKCNKFLAESGEPIDWRVSPAEC